MGAGPRAWVTGGPSVGDGLSALTGRGRAFLAAGTTITVASIIMGQSGLVRVGVLLVMLPDLLWGSWGFAQFGYRRILDAVPLLLLLLGIAYRERADWLLRVTVLVGIVVHAYGIWVINVLEFVS